MINVLIIINELPLCTKMPIRIKKIKVELLRRRSQQMSVCRQVRDGVAVRGGEQRVPAHPADLQHHR